MVLLMAESSENQVYSFRWIHRQHDSYKNIRTQTFCCVDFSIDNDDLGVVVCLDVSFISAAVVITGVVIPSVLFLRFAKRLPDLIVSGCSSFKRNEPSLI